MTKVQVSNEERKTKPHKPDGGKQEKEPPTSSEVSRPEMVKLQETVGNRAAQRFLAQLKRKGDPNGKRGVLVPRHRMQPAVIARSWNSQFGMEYQRVHFLRGLLEGRRYQIAVLARDDHQLPILWTVVQPSGDAMELNRSNVIQRLESLAVSEGLLSGEAVDLTPPDYIASDAGAMAFWQRATQGTVSPGVTVELFGPVVTIERTYGGQQISIQTRQYGIFVSYNPSSRILHVQPFRFAPANQDDAFYRERQSTYDSWQDFNHELYRLVVVQHQSPSDARTAIHAMDQELLLQMIWYCVAAAAGPA